MARESHFESAGTEAGIVDAVLFPFRLIWGFIIFMIFAWTTSRNGRAFIFAVPAMVAAVVCVAAGWAAQFKGESKAIALSINRMSRAATPGNATYDPKAAVLFGKKSVSLKPEEDYLKFKLAEAYALAEDPDKAFEIMDWLAPPVDVNLDKSASGFSDAHLWLSGYYRFSDNIDLDDENREKMSRQHLQLAYNANNSSIDVVLALAALFHRDAKLLQEEADRLREDNQTELAEGKDREAAVVFEQTVKYLNEAIELDLKKPGQLYATTVLMEILQEQGKNEEARMKGMQFINKYENSAISNPDALPYWYSIVQACVLMKDFDRAEGFIERGYRLARNEEVREVLQQLSALINVEKSKSFVDMDDKSEFLARLQAICQSMISNVRSLAAYEQVLYYVDGFETDTQQDDWLRESILGTTGAADVNPDPRIPGMIHVVLGMRDIIQANGKEGRKHWEIAGQQHALAPFAINFLIQVYDRERELNKAKRLHLISAAIKQFPQSAFFYATRGRFLKEEGEFKEAIQDYEFALARIPRNLTFLNELLECYREEGESEKLAKCQEQIRVLEEEALRAESETLASFYSGSETPQKKEE